jgi:hypothetical protein
MPCQAAGLRAWNIWAFGGTIVRTPPTERGPGRDAAGNQEYEAHDSFSRPTVAAGYAGR